MQDNGWLNDRVSIIEEVVLKKELRNKPKCVEDYAGYNEDIAL